MDNPVTPTTPWYQNASTLSHIFNALVGITGAVCSILVTDFHGTIPGGLVKAGGILMTLASAIGIYNNHAS